MLNFYKKKSVKIHPTEDPTSLGNILIKLKLIDHNQLETALRVQNENKDLFLGEILVQIEAIERPILRLAIDQQKALRTNSKTEIVSNHLEHATKKVNDVNNAFDSLSEMIKAKIR
jgi:hypothetical protein